MAAVVLLSCNESKNTEVKSGTTTDTSATGTQSATTEEGFMPLFDGTSTKGWHTYGKTGVGKAWQVVDGTLHLEAKADKDWQTAEGGDIVSDEEFENFHLKYEWKIAPKGNSGLVFFIKEEPQYQYMWHTGPEMQVLDNGKDTASGHPDAKITAHRAGDLYDLIVSKEAVKPAGEWNAAEVMVKDKTLTFFLNGQQTLATTLWDDSWKALIAKSKFKDMPGFGKHAKGRIGLQTTAIMCGTGTFA